MRFQPVQPPVGRRPLSTETLFNPARRILLEVKELSAPGIDSGVAVYFRAASGS